MTATRTRFLEAALTVGCAAAGSVLLWGTVDPALRALAGVGAGVAATVLVLLPGLIASLTPRVLTVLCAFAALLGFALAVAAPAPGTSTPAAAGLGLMAALITALVGSVGRLLARPCADGHAAIAGPAAGLALLTSAPVWLGPVIARTEPPQPVTDAVIALSPLTHLSLPDQVDYLRSDWFYRHTPFGGLRYDYPSLATVTGGYLLACLLAWIVTVRRHRITVSLWGQARAIGPQDEATQR
jgi:hypothetical protein